jgi:membrane protease YdiL (CAAX protease family)
MYFGILTIFAIISETIIGVYYYLAEEKSYPIETGYGIWDYFIINRSIRNYIVLFALLTVSAVMEEIIFRFILMNFLLRFNIGIIYVVIITSILFGLAHYQNGGWIYCVNSVLAGFVFAIVFIEMGLITAWLLHLFWNFIVIFQMFLPLLYEKKEKKKGE